MVRSKALCHALAAVFVIFSAPRALAMSPMDYDRSKAHYRQVIEEDPKSSEALKNYRRWAEAASDPKVARYGDAMYALGKIFEDFPKDPLADDAALSVAYMARHLTYDYETALDWYGKLAALPQIERDPAWGGGIYPSLDHDRVRELTAGLEAVIAEIERLENLTLPENAVDVRIRSHLELGEVLLQEKNFPAALANWNRLVVAFPESAAAAEAVFRAGSLHIHDVPAFYASGFTSVPARDRHIVDRHLRAGISEMNRVLTEYPESGWAPKALLETGKAYMQTTRRMVEGSAVGSLRPVLGEYAEAEKVFLKFLDAYPESPLRPEALFHLAVTLEKTTTDAAVPEFPRRAEALRAFEKLIEEFPDSEFAAEARKRITALK